MVASHAAASCRASDLSETTVKQALDSLQRAPGAPPTRALEHLQLIEEARLASGLPPGSASRRYLLCGLLVDLIREELDRHRAWVGRPPADPSEAREAALGAIGQDVATASADLFGWSWLYAYYVRSELDISRALFCRLASIEPRTLCRYQQQAISRLLYRLLEREQAARQNAGRRRLLAQLPSTQPLALVGRDTELQAICLPCSDWSPRHVQVTGAEGIGKTALAQQAVWTLVNRGALDDLLWLEAPESAQAVRQRIEDGVQQGEVLSKKRRLALLVIYSTGDGIIMQFANPKQSNLSLGAFS